MLYAIEAIGLDRVKLGFTSSDVLLAARLESIACGCPVDVRLIGVFRDGSREDEKELHDLLSDHRVRGEWFQLSSVWAEVGDCFVEWVSEQRCLDCESPLSLGALGKGSTRCVGSPDSRSLMSHVLVESHYPGAQPTSRHQVRRHGVTRALQSTDARPSLNPTREHARESSHRRKD